MDAGSRGLFAFPVSDRWLDFHKLLFAFRTELGLASGDTITWRPIGDPRQSDEVYRRVRNSRQEERDLAGVQEYLNGISALGSEDAYCNEQYSVYADTFGISVDCAPFVVFSEPGLLRRCVLSIDPNCLIDRPRLGQLETILRAQITEVRFNQFRVDGLFTEGSMEDLQHYLDEVSLRIHKIVALKATRLPRRLKLRSGPQDPSDCVNTAVDAKLYWHVCSETGELTFTVVWRGRRRTFKGFYNGKSTKKQDLLLILLQYPNGIHIENLTRQLYPDFNEPNRHEAHRGASVEPRLRTLLCDTKNLLNNSGFPPGILPALADARSLLKLNVLEIKEDLADRADGRLDYFDPHEAPENLGL